MVFDIFLVVVILVLGSIKERSLAEGIEGVDNFVEIIALAGIGMRVSITELLKQGAKASLFCVYIGLAQIRWQCF